MSDPTNDPTTRMDRCDKCHIAAYVALMAHEDYGVLALCGHHLAEYSKVLDEQGWENITDSSMV